MDLRDKLGVNKKIYNEVICPVCGQVTLDSYWNVYETEQQENYKLYVLVAD